MDWLRRLNEALSEVRKERATADAKYNQITNQIVVGFGVIAVILIIIIVGQVAIPSLGG